MSFLKYLKNLRSLNDPLKYTVVSGNQSVDMDSFCSAILTAFIQTELSEPAIPLIPINREDMNLRKDILFLLKKLSIDPDWLLFAEDLTPQPTSKLFLVDHNSPFIKGEVKSIIDHHEIEDRSMSLEGITPLKMVKCGSCMSAIINYFAEKQAIKELFNSNKELPVLALAPIVMDTANLTARVEDEDTKAVKWLDQFSCFYSPATNFHEILTEKSSLEGLSATDLLKKDYKQWGAIGISSIPKKLNKIFKTINKADFIGEMNEYKQKLKLEVLVAMGSNGGKRDLVYLGPSEFDMAKECPDLELQKLETIDNALYYDQRNVAATRKLVAPALRDAYKAHH